jgi:hypothetical protein
MMATKLSAKDNPSTTATEWVEEEELKSGQTAHRSSAFTKALAYYGKITRDKKFGLIKVRDYYYADGTHFLKRYILAQNNLFAIYIHRLTAVNVGYPHTHTWTFWTWVLRGGYTEAVSNLDGRTYERKHTLGSFKQTRRDEAHKIISLKPDTVTLVFAGPLHAEWGFMTEKGYVHWEKHTKGDKSEGEELKRD